MAHTPFANRAAELTANHRSKLDSDVSELETRLYSFLGIPGPENAAESQDGPRFGKQSDWERLESLRAACRELQREARSIGSIPEGYPRHVSFIMNVISRLLPWYTRPLVRFGDRTSRTLTLMSEIIEELHGRQIALSLEIAELRAGSRKNATPSASGLA